MHFKGDQYEQLLWDVLYCGDKNQNERTGVGTVEVFGAALSFDLRNGFPLVTTKTVNFDAVVKELLWFLSGSTNVNDLDSIIWNEWADEDGDLGPIYGAQWRTSGKMYGIDQIKELEHLISEDPQSRRMIVSAWNPGELHLMNLHPCHVMFQVNITPDGRYMDLAMYQRSADMMLGVPFNIASYSLLLAMLAQVHGYEARYFHYHVGNAHIYENHMDGAREQLTRCPRSRPKLVLIPPKNPGSVLNYTEENIRLENYNPHPAIKLEVAV